MCWSSTSTNYGPMPMESKTWVWKRCHLENRTQLQHERFKISRTSAVLDRYDAVPNECSYYASISPRVMLSPGKEIGSSSALSPRCLSTRRLRLRSLDQVGRNGYLGPPIARARDGTLFRPKRDGTRRTRAGPTWAADISRQS